jgi:RNA polymerase sigma-70 factor (ECF subfamily)
VDDDRETNDLLQRIRLGDGPARGQLLDRYRERLRRMVAVRLDPRLAPRLDPSDVVQDALAEAAGGLDDYLRRPPLPFYPWLRHFAWDRLIELHRFHRNAQRRSVTRERPFGPPLPDHSGVALVCRIAAGGTSPSHRLLRDEIRERVREALAALAPHDREILVLRYLEGLTTAETASVLGLSGAAVKSRHMRAIVRLRPLLEDLDREPPR